MISSTEDSLARTGKPREGCEGYRRPAARSPGRSGRRRAIAARCRPPAHRTSPAALGHHRHHPLPGRAIRVDVHPREWSGECGIHLLHRGDPLHGSPRKMVLWLGLPHGGSAGSVRLDDAKGRYSPTAVSFSTARLGAVPARLLHVPVAHVEAVEPAVARESSRIGGEWDLLHRGDPLHGSPRKMVLWLGLPHGGSAGSVRLDDAKGRYSPTAVSFSTARLGAVPARLLHVPVAHVEAVEPAVARESVSHRWRVGSIPFARGLDSPIT